MATIRWAVAGLGLALVAGCRPPDAREPVAAGVQSPAVAAAGTEEATMAPTMTAKPATPAQAGLPPIDAEAPATVETATFALG